MVIAIDGPGGVGKSTVSGKVAHALGYPHLDTGSTYRAAGLLALRSGADLSDAEAVVDAVHDADITIEEGVVAVDGVDVTEELRADEVTSASSIVAVCVAALCARGGAQDRGRLIATQNSGRSSSKSAKRSS